MKVGAAQEDLAFTLAAAVGAPERPGIGAHGVLDVRARVGKGSAALAQRGRELLPLAGGGIALEQLASGPVAVLWLGKQRLVDVDLARARDHIPGALGHDRRGLVVVGLMQEAAARIDVAPQVSRAAHFALARDEGLRVDGFGDAVSPGQVVVVAQQVGHIGGTGALTDVARAAGELAEGIAARVADDIGVLEAGADSGVGLGRAVARVIAAGRNTADRAEGRHLGPWVLAGIGVAGHHGIGHKVPYLGRGLHLAAVGGAEQPVADADHLVFEAVGRERGRHDGRRGDRCGGL